MSKGGDPRSAHTMRRTLYRQEAKLYYKSPALERAFPSFIRGLLAHQRVFEACFHHSPNFSEPFFLVCKTE